MKSEPISSKNHSTNVLVCQPLGKEVLAQVPDLSKNLNFTTGDLYEEISDLVDWEGADLLRKLIKRKRSCMVVGEDEAGKSCASYIAEDDTENLRVISYPDDTYDVYKELWFLLNSVLPGTTSQIADPKQSGLFRKDHVLRCGHCSRRCIIDPYARVKAPIVPTPDIHDIRMMISNVTGKCPLIIKEVNDHLAELQGSIFVIRVPDVDNDLIDLFTQLLEIGTLIILTNPKQAKQLREHNRFRRLPVYRFPKPNADFFLKVLQIRLEDVGMAISPFTAKACLLAALLSQRKPGRYVETLGRALDQFQLDGRKEQIDPTYMLRVVADSMDERSMVLATISNYEGWFGTSELSRDIRDTFDTNISPKRLGWLIKELVDGNKLERRRIGDGKQYKVREPIPLLEAGTIEPEPLPEGEDNGQE